MMERFKPKAKPAQDGLYVEVSATPHDTYKYQARLYDEGSRYAIEYEYADLEWVINWKARRMLARERKKRRLQQAANDYGKKVIR